jgi:hypothetical protein
VAGGLRWNLVERREYVHKDPRHVTAATYALNTAVGPVSRAIRRDASGFVADLSCAGDFASSLRFRTSND